MTKQRIWELDALRGICILGMVVFHLIYDLTYLYGFVDWVLPPFWDLVQTLGGLVFLMLSGLCVTLGRRTFRRGLIVFGSGMLITLVTWVMYRMGMLYYSDVIRFGVLHCLGICMLLWPLLKKLPTWVLGALGVAVIVLGCETPPCTCVSAASLLFPVSSASQGGQWGPPETSRFGAGHAEGGDLSCHLKKHFADVCFKG